MCVANDNGDSCHPSRSTFRFCRPCKLRLAALEKGYSSQWRRNALTFLQLNCIAFTKDPGDTILRKIIYARVAKGTQQKSQELLSLAKHSLHTALRRLLPAPASLTIERHYS